MWRRRAGDNNSYTTIMYMGILVPDELRWCAHSLPATRISIDPYPNLEPDTMWKAVGIVPYTMVAPSHAKELDPAAQGSWIIIRHPPFIFYLDPSTGKLFLSMRTYRSIPCCPRWRWRRWQHHGRKNECRHRCPLLMTSASLGIPFRD